MTWAALELQAGDIIVSCTDGTPMFVDQEITVRQADFIQALIARHDLDFNDITAIRLSEGGFEAEVPDADQPFDEFEVRYKWITPQLKEHK